jgi:hypothetical protein
VWLFPPAALGGALLAALGLGDGLGDPPLGTFTLVPETVASNWKLSITCTSPGGSSRVSTMCSTLLPTVIMDTRTVPFQPLALVKSYSLTLPTGRTLTVKFPAPGRAVVTFMPLVRLAVVYALEGMMW